MPKNVPLNGDNPLSFRQRLLMANEDKFLQGIIFKAKKHNLENAILMLHSMLEQKEKELKQQRKQMNVPSSNSEPHGSERASLNAGCIICYESKADIIYDECWHLCVCSECYTKLPANRRLKCPVCNVTREKTHHAHTCEVPC